MIASQPWADTRMAPMLARIGRGVNRRLERLPKAAVARGLPPGWLGYHWVGQDSPFAYLDRAVADPDERQRRIELIHPAAVAHNPLPINVATRQELPDDAGWWGYSMRDVPARRSDPTYKAILPDCRLLFCRVMPKDNFQVAILGRDDRAIALREIAFRAGHGAMMRAGRPPRRLRKATWILERVYDNHSHWLTAHLPKLVMLRDRGELGDVLLPPVRNATMDSSLRMLGLDPEAFATFDPEVPLQVDELTVYGTDRFRPELLRAARTAMVQPVERPPWRRVFISRARSRGRNLVNEEQLWPALAVAGFERTFMEEMSFEEQVRLMGETQVLLAPHGAGLTNILFCQPGTQVVEIADPDYPNPNFYALAAALGLGYAWVKGRGIGDCHPLDKSLAVDEPLLARTLAQIGRTCPRLPTPRELRRKACEVSPLHLPQP